MTFNSQDTVVINGKTVPKIVVHSDRSETWNMDPVTAAAVNRAVLARIVDGLTGILASR